MAKRNILANASLNGFTNNVFSFTAENKFQSQVHPNDVVDGWTVGRIGNGVFVCNNQNPGFASEGKTFPDGTAVRGGVRLCVETIPGQIYHSLGTLSVGQECVVTWYDILDHYNNNTTAESYSVRIDTKFEGALSADGVEKRFTSSAGWKKNTLSLTPGTAGEYYVSFVGESSTIKRGAIISAVSAEVPIALSATDILQQTKPLQLVYDSQTKLSMSSVDWVFRVLHAGGGALEGQTAVFELIGDEIHFAGERTGESWRAVIKDGQVVLPSETVVLRGRGGEHSLRVRVGTFSKVFPITISGGSASGDWKLTLSAGSEGKSREVVEVGRTVRFTLSLQYKGQASGRQALQVRADNPAPFQQVPSEVHTGDDGLASLSLVAARTGTATITVSHADSGASLPLHVEVRAVVSRRYLLELQRPGNGKLVLNRQDVVQIRVRDAASKELATAVVKMTARVDPNHDIAKVELGDKVASASGGVAEFLVTPKAIGTSSLVFETDPATLAAPLTVALTAQAGASETRLSLSPDTVELLPDSLEDRQPVNVFFDPQPADRPKTIAFSVQEKGSTLRVRQGDLQLLSGHLNVDSKGEAVLQALQVGDEAPDAVLHIQFSADGAQPCLLNVKIVGSAASAKLISIGGTSKNAPLIVDWNALVSQSGCYVKVEGARPGTLVEFHLIRDVEGVADFDAAGGATEQSRRNVRTRGTTGQALLPDIRTGDKVGSFRVDVILAGRKGIVGSFYFRVEQPLPAQALAFSIDRYQHLPPGQAFKIDYVTVYSDQHQRQQLHGGTVEFELQDTNTGSVFSSGDGSSTSLKAKAAIDVHGRALLPEILLGANIGSFTVKASVVTHGAPVVTESKTYTIAVS
ncbi:hypothetical protein [Chromobacterium sp. CV08]|uniref:hypothetical protein n=1 Tax=Chromobacterium sp. CV08 TaxID=3133274 RepID=UPI003DA7F96F